MQMTSFTDKQVALQETHLCRIAFLELCTLYLNFNTSAFSSFL